MTDHTWHPFDRGGIPLKIKGAQGAYLTLEDDRRVLDLISSWWVVTHGHSHPAIIEAIAHQGKKYAHVMFAGLTHDRGIELATQLTRLTNLERVFFSDNGSTAIEVALKMSYHYFRAIGEARVQFLAFEKNYHGDTMGAMSAGFSSGFYEPFKDLVLPFHFAPMPHTWLGDNEMPLKEQEALAHLDDMLDKIGTQLAAVVIEPLVQGAGGMLMSSPNFLRKAVQKIRKTGALVIFDEVMTGFGRSGTMFASNKAQVTPDILCVAKALTGGVMPLAATLTHEELYRTITQSHEFFAHGHSYTANPLACAASLASLALFEKEQTFARIKMIEDIHKEDLASLASLPFVFKPRLTGTIAAFNLGDEEENYHTKIGTMIAEASLTQGMMLRPLGNVVYMMPPYCITQEELKDAWQKLYHVIKANF